MKALLENPAAEGAVALSRVDPEPSNAINSSIEDFHRDCAELQMRVLLRHKKTGRFFCDTDQWTDNTSLARDFHTGWWATAVAVTMDPQNLAVVYDFDDQRYNINIPVIGAHKHVQAPKKRHPA